MTENCIYTVIFEVGVLWFWGFVIGNSLEDCPSRSFVRSAVLEKIQDQVCGGGVQTRVFDARQVLCYL